MQTKTNDKVVKRLTLLCLKCWGTLQPRLRSWRSIWSGTFHFLSFSPFTLINQRTTETVQSKMFCSHKTRTIQSMKNKRECVLMMMMMMMMMCVCVCVCVCVWIRKWMQD
jgi:hypothetical protein